MTIKHKVFAAYSVLKATDVNEYLMNQTAVSVDNESELVSVPSAVKLAFAAATNKLFGRTSSTTWGQIHVSGGMARAVLTQSTAQPTLTGGQWSTINFQVADRDTHGGYSSAQPTRWTCPTGQGGTFLADGKVQTGANYALNSRILVNGNFIPNSTGSSSAGAYMQSSVTGLKIVVLNPGDYVELQGYAPNSWSTQVYGDGASSLTIVRID